MQSLSLIWPVNAVFFAIDQFNIPVFVPSLGLIYIFYFFRGLGGGVDFVAAKPFPIFSLYNIRLLYLLFE